MAHLALTDINGKRFRFTDRINRSGPGWAGAATDGVSGLERRMGGDASGPEAMHRLVASTKEFGLDLRLDERRRAVLHGDRGYSRKGTAPGNASFYYSLTRMPTRGTVTIEGRAIEVTGAELDGSRVRDDVPREGTGGLGLVLDAARRWTRPDGVSAPATGRIDRSAIERHAGGARTVRSGTSRSTTAFALEPGRVWTSPRAGAGIRSEWRVRIPRESIDLSVAPRSTTRSFVTGESTGVNYWEGAIDVTWSRQGTPGAGPRLSRDDRLRRRSRARGAQVGAESTGLPRLPGAG